MQTIPASVILDDLYHLMDWDPTQLEDRQKQQARSALSTALEEVWDAWWWEELMRCVPLAGATVYNSAWAFAADDFCYYPASQKYYQAMQATTGNVPATVAADGAYTPNYAYWAEAAATFTGDDFTPGDYLLGDWVRSLENGFWYQRIQLNADIIISGAGVTTVNQGCAQSGTLNDRPQYVAGDISGLCVRWQDSLWQIGVLTPGGGYFTPLYVGNVAAATPDLVAGWYSVAGDGSPDPTNDPAPTVISGQADPAELPLVWHALVPFTPEITLAGKVRTVATTDPRLMSNSGEVDFEESTNGVLLPGWTTGAPWVWYRRPTPVLTGDDYSATQAYAATPAADLVFNDMATITATATEKEIFKVEVGETPEGQQTVTTPSFAACTDGRMWFNPNSSGNTGWIQILG